MSNLRIKQITLPSGNTYLIYDEATRDMITSKEYTTGVAYSVGDLVVYEDNLYRVTVAISAQDNTGWSAVSKSQTTIDSELATIRESVTQVMKYRGVTTTELTDGSTTATITINGQSVTFTAADAGSVVISGTGADQKEFVWSGTTWNEFGSTGALKALAFKDSASGTYDKTTSITLTVPTVSATTQKLSATATGGAATITSTAAAVTGYSPTTPKLVTTSVPNVTGNSSVTATNTVFGTSTTASKATAGTAITVAKKGTSTNVASGALGTETSTRTADTPMWGASVTNETLSFTFKPLSTTSIIPADSTTETITPYSFADVTVPVVSSNTEVSASSITLGTAITVATGSVDANGSGASVVTALGDPATANCATAISLSTQPTVTLSLDDTTGDVTVATNVSTSGSASATPNHTSTTITVS